MTVHVQIPYSVEKNFGAACNREFERCPDGDWICILDHDAMLLTPDAVAILTGYAEHYPDAMMVCFSNRSGSHDQQPPYGVSTNDSMKHWIRLAEHQRARAYKATPVSYAISGFLMLISKKMWLEVGGFNEGKRILGVDRDFAARVIEKGYQVLRMDGMLCFHAYRLNKNVKDRGHLL